MVARKTSDTVTCSFGVVSWEIAVKSRRVVIMWSLPYDYNLHSYWLAVGITKPNVINDDGLADQMYYYGSNAKLGFERQEYYYSVPTVQWEEPELGLIFFATMSTTQHSLVKVTFSAKIASDLAKPIRDHLDKNQKKKRLIHYKQ
ncbi:hypothetical protein DPMN_178860 [Dreissena polymorpha]|uniref:Uncharacterized protein n=1 Tax=Dreissena polymorpha TaxID=45954 RepID=A0A9D4EBR0_DREPO|nr:hypothetical protein DPMN_178860 [Dreissena polymorpha]